MNIYIYIYIYKVNSIANNVLDKLTKPLRQDIFVHYDRHAILYINNIIST